MNEALHNIVSGGNRMIRDPEILVPNDKAILELDLDRIYEIFIIELGHPWMVMNELRYADDLLNDYIEANVRAIVDGYRRLKNIDIDEDELREAFQDTFKQLSAMYE
jgi:hypothetical protein